jgi:serine/threonine protein kinase
VQSVIAPTGSLEVLSEPAGASVYLDDEPIGSTDPDSGRLVKSGLTPGRHRVRLSRADRADTTVEIEIAAGATQTLRAVLSPLRADPGGARTGLLAFAVLAVVAVAAIAWLALRRPRADPARRVTQPSGLITDSSGLATPRALVNPGARLDTRGQEWFGEYRLLEVLGRGGMASVYKAERRQELVALKRPLGSLLDNPEFLDRFLREAEIGRTLNHPNIVRILERGNIEGVPYFTMELVPGETLFSYLGREGAAQPRFAARVVVQVAEALDFAHGKGVVHRDLKPSNIMLLPDGSVRVMDFGIARAERFGTLTATSAFLGTPHYVAPEMVDGPGAEARSDLYALGVVFFELLTGTRPFVADTPFAILKKHVLEEPPPPSRVRPGVPPELDALVLQLLRKTPAERPAGAEALVIALRDFLRRAA